jgi:hypothetical protein
VDEPAEDNLFFDNTFRRYIDAAIHAFVGDAASFRDLLAETTWRLVLRGTEPVRKLSAFLRAAKSTNQPIAQEILEASNEGGWLKGLTDLRNHITHVAPVGRGSSLQFCQPRVLTIASEVQVLCMHYPLLDESGAVREHPFPVDKEKTAIKKALENYKSFADTSQDALQYAWVTLNKLVQLFAEVRSVCALRSEIPHLTDADIIGKPTFKPI